MKKTFPGFDNGPYNMIQIPAPFFSQVLPLVDDLAELKLILFCFWALPQKEGRYPYLRCRDFTNNTALMESLSKPRARKKPEQVLQAALERAVKHGILLAVTIQLDDPETLYFMNTERGRAATEQIKAGRWQPGDQDNPVEILPERPNIFRLYEQNIGQLTPLIVDHLKDFEAEFPTGWVEEAIRQAVAANKRSLNYIRAILKKWRKEGKDSGEFTGRRDEEDGKRYLSGPYADFINR
jgi:DNA replication protein